MRRQHDCGACEMSKHTPGPWKVTGAASGGISVDAKDPADGRGFELCEVWGIDCDKDSLKDDRAKANANLIAAAPDLLEALEAVVKMAIAGDEYSYADWGKDYVEDVRVTNAKAIIVRAKGKL